MVPLLLRQDVSEGSSNSAEQDHWAGEHKRIKEPMCLKIAPAPNNKRNERRPRYGED